MTTTSASQRGTSSTCAPSCTRPTSARDVDRYVTQRIDHRQGDVTTEQVEAWEREGYRRWRENWPALNGLLIPHGSLGEPDGGSTASCGCGNDAAHAPRTAPSDAGTP